MPMKNQIRHDKVFVKAYLSSVSLYPGDTQEVVSHEYLHYLI